MRVAKVVLMASVSLLMALVVFNNLTDYAANFGFVSHVLSMDTTFRNPAVMWRAIDVPALQHAAYALIIGWEALTAALCAIGAFRMLAASRRRDAAAFASASRWAIYGLTCGIVLWLTGFIAVGGEWFLMWQSEMWNGQDAAFRMFAVNAATLLVLAARDE